MRKWLPHSTIACLMAFTVIGLGACNSNAVGVTSAVVSNTPPQAIQSPYVITRSITVSYAADMSHPFREATSTCQGSERAVGGGYRFETAYFEPRITELVPDANAWTVGFYLGYPFKVTISAQCLVGGAGTVSVQSATQDFPSPATDPWTNVQATCPAGTTNVGGGFAIRDGIAVVDLYPTGGGHFVNRSGHDLIEGVTAYATCYSPAATVSTIRDHKVVLYQGDIVIQSGTGYQDWSYSSASVWTSCRPGTSLTSGGYEDPFFRGDPPKIDGPDPQATVWHLELFSLGQISASGLSAVVQCVTF